MRASRTAPDGGLKTEPRSLDGSALEPRAPRSFLTSPDTEPPGQFGLNLGPLDVTVPEQHQRVKDEVRHLADQMIPPGLARLIRRLHDFSRLLHDLSADLLTPPFSKATT